MNHVRGLGVAVALVVAAASAGCLVKETESTIYLEPDGRLQWVVFERQVRSDAETAAERQREESSWRDAVLDGRHPVAEAFRALEGEAVRTTVVRGTRPYAVRVDATFPSLATLLAPALAACGVPYESWLSTQGGVTTWTFEADARGDDGLPEACDTPFEGLIDAADVTILLTNGRFVGSRGFRLTGGDRATLDEDAVDGPAGEAADRVVRLSLSWAAAAARRP